MLLAIAPLLAAALIAISRLEDYRHDVFDVTVGGTLGFIVMYTIYRRYYPSLSSKRCDTPYAAPKFDDEDGVHRKRSDEELGASNFGLEDIDDSEEDRMLSSQNVRPGDR